MSSSAPTNATQAKERLYAQLAASLNNMSRSIGQTADLMEQLQIDLHAMRTFAGLDAAKFMVVADSLKDRLSPTGDDDDAAVEGGEGELEEEGQSVAPEDDDADRSQLSDSDRMEA